ncbi:tyrosine-type recombinase/integrase [Clostridium estertheticum]|uniref:tyrosine-type recombinase/integrase n=1 Tax=Clostridium estertheticum TaxID=238834 RepID=UPI002431DD28|nr:tyrosine-type recombinase/integrase [Clostridium estertheticum]
MIKENEEKVKYLTQVEMKKVFKVIEKDISIHALRNLTIFRVAYRCALRASELGLIHLEDYNKTREEMYCHRLKGSNNNTIILGKMRFVIISKFCF